MIAAIRNCEELTAAIKSDASIIFIVDSHSAGTTIESSKVSKADMIEIMPGTVEKVIKMLRIGFDIPVVAGVLIETEAEIKEKKNKHNALKTAVFSALFLLVLLS